MATAREVWEASMALRGGAPYPGQVLRLGEHEFPVEYDRRVPPGTYFLIDRSAYERFVSHRPRGATIARSRALRRWRVACHRARKGLARSFPVTTGFGLAPVNGGIRRRLNPSL
jgi:hypothetical protein